jgi:hypothetical protein
MSEGSRRNRLRVRFVVDLDLRRKPSPSEVRRRFVDAVRQSIVRAHCRGALHLQHGQECWRAVPASADPEAIR